MKIYAHGLIEATEAVQFRDRSDLDVTVFASGEWLDGRVYGDTDCQIKGTIPQRIDFLLRLADAAQRAADELAGKCGSKTDAVLREVGAAYCERGDR